MKRRIGALTVAAALTALAVASATAVISASTAIAGAAGRSGATVRLGQTNLGRILTASNGFTVYTFSRDRRNRDACVKISGCTASWPPLTKGAKPIAGRGLKAKLLGSISLPSGMRQVTYAGHPLYRYVGDTGPRQTDYVGISASGGVWSAITAAGRGVR